MTIETEQASFGRELFGFLAELKDNNDRDWFNANKARYEADVLEPSLAFIEDFAPYLHQISPHLRADARRVGGSLFRIYRDTRFSKDKTPYKTTAGIWFKHERAKDVHAPGFYLHLAPGDVFAGGGIWHPDTPTADEDPRRDRGRPRRLAGGHERHRARHGGGAQARPVRLRQGPSAGRGPQAQELRRPRAAEREGRDRPDFLQRYARACESMAPTMRFLCRAIGVPF